MYPLCDFKEICRVLTSFQDVLAVKIFYGFAQGITELWGFKLTGMGSHKFSAPPSRETMRRTPKFLEVQERAWGPLLPCQVWWGSDFTRHWGGQKHTVFSLTMTLLNDGVSAHYSPWNCWSIEMVLILLDTRQGKVCSWWHYKMLTSIKW